MWTVLSQTRKAIPGLAVLLLAIILAGCIVFAYHVTRVKNRQFGLDLDQPVKLSTPAGEFAIKIPSRWESIPRSRLSQGMFGGWKFAVPGQEGFGVFYVDLLPIQPTTESELGRIINHYVPSMPKLKLNLDERPDSPLGFRSLDVKLMFQAPRDINVLIMRLYFLPDGSSLAVLITGPQKNEDIIRVWMDMIVVTLKLTKAKPAESDTEMPPINDGPTNQTSVPETNNELPRSRLHVASL